MDIALLIFLFIRRYYVKFYLKRVCLHLSVSPRPRLLNTLSSYGCNQKQETESALNLQSFHSAYPTIPWLNEVTTQSYMTNKRLNNFMSTKELKDLPVKSNECYLEKKAPISFSVESIIGTKK